MNSIETNRTNFFPHSKQTQEGQGLKKPAVNPSVMKRNDYGRTMEINKLTGDDAKVQINDAIKDFSRIKKAVDSAPEIDNQKRIADLKQQIQAGTYKVDYDALADKLLTSEF